MTADFERLVSEAEEQRFSGWDFSFLKGRYLEGKLSWDFGQEVHRLMKVAHSMVDLGTGGGEFLSSLAPLPEGCCVTEGYKPNLKVARDRLEPLGVDVVETFCEDNGLQPQRGALPFRDRVFDLIIDRHESYVPSEVERTLKGGGIFATQQVGEDNFHELREFFGKGSKRVPERKTRWDLAGAVSEIEAFGMKVLKKGEESVTTRFLDVGALAFQLKVTPWEAPGYDFRRDRAKLLEAHRVILKKGGFDVTRSRFYFLAMKE